MVYMMNLLWVAIIAAATSGSPLSQPPESSRTSVSEVPMGFVQEASSTLEPEVPATLELVDAAKYLAEYLPTAELDVSISVEPENATKPVQQARLRSSQKPKQPRRQETQAELWAHRTWFFQSTYGSDRMISMDDLMRHSKPVKIQLRSNVNNQNKTRSSH